MSITGSYLELAYGYNDARRCLQIAQVLYYFIFIILLQSVLWLVRNIAAILIQLLTRDLNEILLNHPCFDWELLFFLRTAGAR